MLRPIDTKFRRLGQKVDKENDSEYGNNRNNYASQPNLNNMWRYKDVIDNKKKLLDSQKLPFLHKLKDAELPPNKLENQNYITHYAHSLNQFFISKENSKIGDRSFLRNHDIDSELRARMVDWLIEVSSSYKCTNTTYFKTVAIMDTYFAKETRRLPISKLHLIGVVSLYMGTKMDEIYPIKLRTIYDKIGHKKLPEKDIVEQEMQILEALDFNLVVVSIFEMATLILHTVGCADPEKVQETIAYIGKIVLMNYSILYRYSQHTIAINVLILSLVATNNLNNTAIQRIVELAGFEEPLKDCRYDILKAVKEFKSKFSNLQNLLKFSKVNHEQICVALFQI